MELGRVASCSASLVEGGTGESESLKARTREYGYTVAERIRWQRRGVVGNKTESGDVVERKRERRG
jgi:hypothetical protein